MPKFEEKFVRFTWSDELEGKNVLGADHINDLIKMVESGESSQPVKRSTIRGYTFELNNRYDRIFAYYDPDYDEKALLEKNATPTFKELHEWLAQGQGRYMVQGTIQIDLNYHISLENELISHDVLVCRWKDTEWVKPTKEYLRYKDDDFEYD